jgi:hypothetical protein
MDGRATLTMDVSSMTTNCADTRSPRATHWLWRAVVASAAGVGRMTVVGCSRVVDMGSSFGVAGSRFVYGPAAEVVFALAN